MRRVRKGPEPAALQSWKATITPRSAIPSWDRDFPSVPRNAVRDATSREQGQLCCYCTGTITGGAFHIEHFKPRETYPRLTYHWANLLASCEGYQQGAITTAVVETQCHCGHAKSNWFEEGVTVDPQAAQVESCFRYPLTGRIAPEKRIAAARRQAAERTIEALNLNAPSLIERRRSILERAATDALTLDRADWLVRYTQPTLTGELQEFWPALSYNYHLHWSASFDRERPATLPG